MPKISTLPDYDLENPGLDDYIPVVQGGVTKKITRQQMIQSAFPDEITFNGNPTQTALNAFYAPTYPQSHLVIRIPNNAIFICVYDGTSWFYERLQECAA